MPRGTHLHGGPRQTHHGIPLTGTEQYPNIRRIRGKRATDAFLKRKTGIALAACKDSNLTQKPDLDIAGEAAELLTVLLSNRVDFQIISLPCVVGRVWTTQTPPWTEGLKLLLPRPMDLEDVRDVRSSLGTGCNIAFNGCMQPVMRPSRVN
ncbi:hypothetical protein ES703_48446 [subsurface metagenome]